MRPPGVEWLIGSPTGAAVARAPRSFPDNRTGWVPAMVRLELAEWLSREAGEDKAGQVIAFPQPCRVVRLDTAIALAARTGLPRRRHRLRDGGPRHPVTRISTDCRG